MEMRLLILGLFLVTYLPRYLPFRWLDVKNIPPFMRRFLANIPNAALGALIIPGVFYSVEENVAAAVFGALTAAAVSIWTKSLLNTVLGAVAVATFILIIFPPA